MSLTAERPHPPPLSGVVGLTSTRIVRKLTHRYSGQPFNDVIGLPKAIVVALAHAVRHLISYGLSEAFKKTTFFSTFLTRSHMLLNANTLENLYVNTRNGIPFL